jgi:hypothetical protein
MYHRADGVRAGSRGWEERAMYQPLAPCGVCSCEGLDLDADIPSGLRGLYYDTSVSQANPLVLDAPMFGGDVYTATARHLN